MCVSTSRDRRRSAVVRASRGARIFIIVNEWLSTNASVRVLTVGDAAAAAAAAAVTAVFAVFIVFVII